MWWTTKKRESNNDYYDDGIYMFSVCVSTHEMTNTKHTNDNELEKKWKKKLNKKGKNKDVETKKTKMINNEHEKNILGNKQKQP